MFLRFVLENHLSFREETELSFIATSRKEEPSWMMKSRHVKHGVLPVVGVWGANASGKTNLLAGLLQMRDAVRYSHTLWGPTETVRWYPWRLQRDESDIPTRMELEFVLDEVRFAYGFSVAASGFMEEWLYRWEGSRRQVLFHRDANAPEDERFYFGPSLRGERAAIARRVRNNSLFLSAAAQENHPQLLAVYSAIADGVQPASRVELTGYPIFDSDDLVFSDRFRPVLLNLLRASDLGIVDIRFEDVEDVRLPDNAEVVLNPAFLETLREHLSGTRKARVVFVHRDANGDRWELPPEFESGGTQMLLARLRDAIQILDGAGLWVIDELDTSLHPVLCAALVALFTQQATNPRGAQLLFTTHERELLNQLRTDEVVLVDKARSGESSLAAASDYRTVRGRTDLRLAHEQGKIGGVPVLEAWAAVLEQD